MKATILVLEVRRGARVESSRVEPVRVGEMVVFQNLMVHLRFRARRSQGPMLAR